MSDQPDPDDLPAQVRAACTTLAQHHGVTFPAVTEYTGISRATLYRRRDLREIIEAYRDPDGNTTTITGLATQIDQLCQALEAIAAKVRRHEEDLRTINAKVHTRRDSPEPATPPNTKTIFD